MGLFNGIMAIDILRIIKVLRTLPSKPNSLAALRDNRLAQIVIKVLFGVGLARSEFSNARMCHWGSVQF
jgi:hypothetical protein